MSTTYHFASLRAAALCGALTIALIAGTGIGGCHEETSHAAERNIGFVIPALRERGAGLNDKEFAKTKEMYEKLRERIASNPNDIDAYTVMAQIFMQEARITGRHHDYIPQATLLLDEALRRGPGDFSAQATKGSLLMTLHQFSGAKAIIERAVAENPYSAFAFGVLCDAHVELGEYGEAVKACDSMLAIRPDLRSYARASYIREIHGDRAGAVAAMKMAADAGAFGFEDRAWALYNLGNLFLNQGKLDTAAYIYNGILEERPNYAFAMSGLAMTKRARGDNAGAIELLVKASQLSPEHLFVEQLSDIYLAMGARDAAHTIEMKALDAFRAHEKGGWNIDREYALYCANHDIDLPEALQRAKRELDRRPDNIDAEDTYAWALYKNGRAADAIPYVEKAMRLGSANAILHYHAGMIYDAAGNRAKSKTQLRLALAQNPYLKRILNAKF
jgi:tetratricopeptide (TPR) repeat protein